MQLDFWRPMKYKLVCFDLDGTIIDDIIFIWQTLNEGLGVSKEVRQFGIDSFKSGKFSYSEWAHYDIEEWKKAGTTKEKILELLKPLKLVKGAKETLVGLKKEGYKLALISGSIDIALDILLPDYDEIFDDVFINKLKFNDDGSIDAIEPTAHDFEHKATALKDIAKREGLDLKECVFVGDHENDVHVAEEAGFSIAFNCKSDMLAQISDVVIEKKDLREIIKYL